MVCRRLIFYFLVRKWWLRCRVHTTMWTKEKKIRNGSTILKTSTYKKLGYIVFEIPASDVTNKDKLEQLIRELNGYFLNGGGTQRTALLSQIMKQPRRKMTGIFSIIPANSPTG